MSTLLDIIETSAARLEGAGVSFGHGTDNARDEAAALVLHALELPPDGAGVDPGRRLTGEEERAVRALVERRVRESVPLPYLTGQTTFAGLRFRVDDRALVPRSPIAELIVERFEPWVRADDLRHVLDLCTGGGCMAVAMAAHLPGTEVDAVDLSDEALALAAENVRLHEMGKRVNLIRSDLYGELEGRRYDLIVSNPPYVGRREYDRLPDEYHREPLVGLLAGRAGLELILRVLAGAPAHLTPHGVLIGEVGNSRAALEAALPGVTFTWLDFRRGGEGVFLLEDDALREAAESARRVLAGRGMAEERA